MTSVPTMTKVLKMSAIVSRKYLMEAAMANDLARVRKSVKLFPCNLTEVNEWGETPLLEYTRYMTKEARCRKVEAQLTPPFRPQGVDAWASPPAWYGAPGGWDGMVAW
jgi:hypothetical protein